MDNAMIVLLRKVLMFSSIVKSSILSRIKKFGFGNNYIRWEEEQEQMDREVTAWRKKYVEGYQPE